MRTPLTTSELERYVSNDRITISIRRDDLTVLGDLVQHEGESFYGGAEVEDDNLEAQEYLTQLDRLDEVISLALRTQ